MGTWDWGTFFNGAGLLSTGVGAIAAATAILACGAAAPLMAAVASVTVVAGALTAANGAAEIVEAGTGYNVVRDGIFGGNAQAYGTFRDVTATVAAIGTAITGAYYGSNGGNVCFVEGTLVQTEQGAIPIEDITTDIKVWAWDEDTGDVGLKRVVETYENETYELVHVFVNGEEIVTTPAHPFYSPVKGWTQAVHLRAGDILVLVNGEYVVVEKVQHEILESPIKVYNFNVEDYHTYYVTEHGVLVHNVCTNQNNPGATGQQHHPISNKIQNAASSNPNLAGSVTRKGWGTIQAKTSADHLGYQQWHRDFDQRVLDWLGEHGNATLSDFVQMMNSLYAEPAATRRFGSVIFSIP